MKPIANKAEAMFDEHFWFDIDGHVLFMASEQAFWKNFCQGVDRMDLFEAYPGAKYADHAKGNVELQRELQAVFKTKTCQEWLAFSEEWVTTIAPVNTTKNIGDDPHFKARMDFYPADALGCEQLPLPAYVNGELPPCPTMAPEVGENTDQVMTEVLGKSADDIAALRAGGAFG